MEKNSLGQRREPKTTQPHMASTPEFEPGSSVLITTPFLLPLPLQFLLSQEVMAGSIATRKKGAKLGIHYLKSDWGIRKSTCVEKNGVDTLSQSRTFLRPFKITSFKLGK